MNLIKINGHDYLVPESIDVGRLFFLLTKLEPCNEYLYQGKIYVPGENEDDDVGIMRPIDVCIKPVPPKTKFIVKNGEVETVVEVSAKAKKVSKKPLLQLRNEH